MYRGSLEWDLPLSEEKSRLYLGNRNWRHECTINGTLLKYMNGLLDLWFVVRSDPNFDRHCAMKGACGASGGGAG